MIDRAPFRARLPLLALLILAVACGDGAPPPPLADGAYPRPEGSHRELGLAGWAKVLCSAVFVSGREPREAVYLSGYNFLPEEDRERVRWEVDRERREVRMRIGELSRTARFYGDQGCIIHPRDHDGIFFQPVPVTTSLPEARSQPWPMGDAPGDAASGTPLPPEIDAGLLERAVAAAFEPPAAHTAAFLVLYRGRIVAERYAPRIDRDTQLESWSMGKSLTATLIGVLIERGELGLDQPAPVPAWRGPGDPRAQIRVRDLLQMSSGLRFSSHRDPGYDPATSPYLDHFYVYTGAVDVFAYSIERPLEFPAGSTGRYRNCDPLVLGYLIRQANGGPGAAYLTFPQRALFDRIGIRRQVLETDPYGNFLLTGFDYGTARNWARLGLLYLRDGVWQGERILPPGFVDFVRSPAPAWEEPVYGGLFWLNRTGRWPLPEDAYAMAGAGGQRVFIVPSLDLVVVRLGHFRGGDEGTRALDRALELLVAAVGRRPSPAAGGRRLP